MIDLKEQEKLVYKLIHQAGIPKELVDDSFQDFAVHFYESYQYTEDSKYKISTYINMLFHNWLSRKAYQYNVKDATMAKLSTSIGDKREDWMDWKQSQEEDWCSTTSPELSSYCEEMLDRLKPLTVEYILERSGGKFYDNDKEEGVIRRTAREEGVSRQAIESRIKRDIKRVRNS